MRVKQPHFWGRLSTTIEPHLSGLVAINDIIIDKHMIKIISKKENKIVTRRNDLIEARFRLSLQEQRLMY